MRSTVSTPAAPTIVAMAVTLLLAAPCHAQGAAAPAPAASSPQADADDGAIRVVVTAQKRPQFADKVPMSLSAISKDQLEKQGAVDISDLSRLTPGVTARTSTIFGTPDLSIRGIASTAGAATTAINIDDAAIQTRGGDAVAGGTAYPQLFDLDRVEVLRGPQGTLFGSGAEGGAIRFITPTPSLDTFSGAARVGVSGSERGAASYEAGAAVGSPIIKDQLGFRASLWHRHQGGYIDHVDRETGDVTGRNTNGEDTTVARAALLFKPVANLTISPSIFFQDGLQRDRATYYEGAGLYNTYNHVKQPTHDRFALSTLGVAYDNDSVELKSVTSWFARKQDRTDDYSYALTPAFTGGAEVVPGLEHYVALNLEGTSQKNLSQEFRVSSVDDGNSRWNWTAGVYFSRSSQLISQHIQQDVDTFTETLFGIPAIAFFGSPAIGPDGQYSYVEADTLNDRSAAVFGESYFKLLPSTTLTLGLRAGRNSFDFSTHEDGPLAGGPVAFDGTQRGHSLLPKVALSHDLTKSDMVYASASKGNRVGGANATYATLPGCAADLAALGIADAPRTYKDDTVWSYELGYKGRMLNQTLDVAASAFIINWSDIQQRVTLPTCRFGYTDNLGSARSQGADLQLQLRATRQLTLSATAAYTDAHYTKTTYASSTPTGTPLVASGQALPQSAWSMAAGAEYGWQLAAGRRAHVRADWQYQGGYKRTGPVGAYDYDAGTYRAPSTHYVTFHGGVDLGSTSVSLFLDNAFDSHTELTRVHNLATDPDYQTITYRPRTLGVTVDYKF